MYVIQLRRFLFSAGSPILLFLSSAVRAEVPKTVLTCLGTRKRSRPRTNDFGSTPTKIHQLQGSFWGRQGPISTNLASFFCAIPSAFFGPAPSALRNLPRCYCLRPPNRATQSYHARYCTQVQRCRHTIGADSTSTSFLTRRTRGKKKSETTRTQSKKGSRDILSGKTSKPPLIARRKHSSCPPTPPLQSPFLPS